MHMEIILALFRISLWPFKDDPFFSKCICSRIGTILENWLPLILKNELVHTDPPLNNSASTWHTDISWVAGLADSSWPL